MISNERPSPFSKRPPGSRPHRPPHPQSHPQRQPENEETLKLEKIQVERKTFAFALKENSKGRFLRITEDVAGRRDMIIVPAPGLEDFRRVIEEMIQVAAETPPKITEA